jgi:cell division protein FtsQ
VQLPSTYQTPRGGTDTKGSHPQASSGSDASSLQRAGAPQKSERAPHKHKRLKSTARDSAQTKSATQRKTERKQRERKRHRQGQVIRQVLLAMAVLALVAAAVWGGFELLRSSWFAATTVQIVGAEQLDAGQVRKVAAIAADESVVLLTTSQVRRRLLKNPWIADLHIEKRLPHTIIITIGERSPQAFIKVGEQTWLVSRDGRWLGVYDSEAQLVLDPEGLQAAVPLKSTGVVAVEELATDLKLKPQMGALARGEVLENLLAILRGLTSGLRARVVRAAAADLTRTALFTADGIELDIGRASHLAEKNQIITKILKEQEGKVVLINVRSIEKPTWRGLNQ